MKGVVYLGASEVEVREFPDPVPGPGQVVIQMQIGGLCGSDLHKYHSSREWARAREGMISGHEPAGIVAATGADVRNVAVGDRVCVYHRVGCGYCVDCVSGMSNFCAQGGAFGRTQDGSHADFMLSEARYCLPLPEALSFEVGTQLACTAGTAFSAVSKLPIRRGQKLVVFGLGPVGLAAYLIGVGMGCDTIGVEVSPHRVEQARRIGGGQVVDASRSDAVPAIREMANEAGVGGVVECSGNATARTQAAAIAGRGATLIYVGVGPPDLTVNIGDLLGKDLTIRGNSVYSMGAYFDAVAFLQSSRVPLDDIVTHRFSIEEGAEAFRLFDSGETGKVVFDWT